MFGSAKKSSLVFHENPHVHVRKVILSILSEKKCGRQGPPALTPINWRRL
jgi:hypothetical protein